MKFSLLPIPFLVFALAFVAGCNESKPPGLPDLYKAKITITLKGQPCSNAKVSIVPAGGSSQWSSGGTTNESGVLQPVTHGKYPGIPAGKYRVAVDRSIGEGEPPPPSPIDAESKKKYDAYIAAKKTYHLFQTIPDKYRLRDKTPLEIEVKADGPNDFPLDIPEEVKTEIKSSGLR